MYILYYRKAERKLLKNLKRLMDIDEFEKKLEGIIEGKFKDDVLQVEPFHPSDSELLMLIPCVGDNQIIIHIPNINKSEVEIVKNNGVVFIDLSFKIKKHRKISKMLDKLSLCCRNRYLLDGIKNLSESVKKKNSIGDKFIPFVLMPDLVFILEEDMWSSVENKDFTEMTFNIISMTYDILEDEEDKDINRFGRHIHVVDILV